MITKLKIILKEISLVGIRNAQKLADVILRDENIHLVSRSISPEQLIDIQARLNFYVPGRTLKTHSHLPLAVALGSRPVLTFGENNFLYERYKHYRGGIFNIDHNKNPLAGWDLEERVRRSLTNLSLEWQPLGSWVQGHWGVGVISG